MYGGMYGGAVQGGPQAPTPAAPAGGGGGFNWGMALAGMLQGVGAGLSSVGGTYGHVGAGILGGAQPFLQLQGDAQKLGYMQDASTVALNDWKQRLDERLAAERDEYEWQREYAAKMDSTATMGEGLAGGLQDIDETNQTPTKTETGESVARAAEVMSPANSGGTPAPTVPGATTQPPQQQPPATDAEVLSLALQSLPASIGP